MKRHVATAAALVALAGLAFAQGQKREPRGTATAMVNGKKLTIEYGRPALKGRSSAELLKQLPADRIWRAGENEVTTLTTDTDLMIGGKRVPAGKYSVYVYAPETGDWSLVLNSDPGIALIKLWDKAPASEANKPWPRLDGYDKVKDKEIVRATLKSSPAKPPVEVFTVNLTPAKEGATLNLAWGDKSWTLDVKPAK
jgi:hypothetical protein